MADNAVREPQRRAILKRKFAKELRANTTEAERKLWRLLRNRQFAGLKFRRQQPIGPFIADFYCSVAKLVIELDGEQHAASLASKRDQGRTKWLEARGYRVLRLWNADLRGDSIAAEIIARAIEDSRKPLPEPLRCSTLPQGEGGK
jgi:very-short-patch-repair endonuclease